MNEKKISVICDRRTLEDRDLGYEAKGTAWNQRPFYLLNKVLKNRKNVEYVLIDTIGEHSFEGVHSAFLHLDRDVHPESYAPALRLAIPKEVHLANRDITDITKRYTEQMYVSMGGPSLSLKDSKSYQGKVIVKSIHNAGDPKGREYNIMEVSDVLEEVWSDLEVLVQPFISSRESQDEGDISRTDRHVIFLGESVICSFYSKEPIIKRRTSIWEYFRDIDKLETDFGSQQRICLNDLGIFYRCLSADEKRNQETILEYARLVGLDFGSIDTITNSKDNLYILDVNKTPWERGIPEEFINIFRKQLENNG